MLHSADLHEPRGPYPAPAFPAVFPDGSRGWFIVGYEEARSLLADPRLHKADPRPDATDAAGDTGEVGDSAGASPRIPEALVSHMLAMDPPQHTRLRRLVGKAFTAGTVARLRPRIQQIADELLDAIPTPGPVDLLAAFASPLPITVICELLGVPVQDRADVKRWSESVTSAFTDRTEADAQALLDYLSDLVAQRRAHPSGDPLSDLVHVSDGADRFTDTELTSMACLLLVAGHETTTNLIGTGVWTLLRTPEQLAELRQDPALVPGAVEELLRLSSPAHIATTRFTSEPVQVGGTEIPAGERVMISLLAANRDAAHFTDPDRLDLTRKGSGHLAFGRGIHHCLGAPLARLEADIALRTLLREFSSIELAHDQHKPLWRDSTMIHGLPTLEVTLRRNPETIEESADNAARTARGTPPAWRTSSAVRARGDH